IRLNESSATTLRVEAEEQPASVPKKSARRIEATSFTRKHRRERRGWRCAAEEVFLSPHDTPQRCSFLRGGCFQFCRGSPRSNRGCRGSRATAGVPDHPSSHRRRTHAHEWGTSRRCHAHVDSVAW